MWRVGEFRLIARQFRQEFLQSGITRDPQLAPQPFEQVTTPLGEIDDLRSQSSRVKADAQYVRRRLQQAGVNRSQQRPDCLIGAEEIPVAIECKRRVRFVGSEKPFD